MTATANGATTAQGPVIVVTGASGGLGRAIVREFAKQKPGARIGLVARGEAGLQGALRDVEASGGKGLICQADVSDPEQVEAAAEKVERELGPIDIWVNDAMVTVFSPFSEMSMEDFRRVTEVTYLGFIYGTHSALKRMIPRDRGKVIQVGSALAYRGIPLQSAYCGSKHAIQGFTEAVRSELLHDHSSVKLIMVQMPALNTPQFTWCKSNMPRRAQPVPPIFQPEVGARAVVWAADHDRPEIYVGWPTEKAIWGNRFIPRLLDHYLAHKGWDSQMTDEQDPHDRPIDLYQPADADKDYGAHGRFDRRARGFSSQVWLEQHRGWIGAAAGVAAAIVGAMSLFGRGND